MQSVGDLHVPMETVLVLLSVDFDIYILLYKLKIQVSLLVSKRHKFPQIAQHAALCALQALVKRQSSYFSQ